MNFRKVEGRTVTYNGFACEIKGKGLFPREMVIRDWKGNETKISSLPHTKRWELWREAGGEQNVRTLNDED